MIEILDTRTFQALSIKQLRARFHESAADAGILHSKAEFLFAQAIEGVECSRELVEETCAVTFVSI
jgi:hypothetical protein